MEVGQAQVDTAAMNTLCKASASRLHACAQQQAMMVDPVVLVGTSGTGILL